MDGGVIWQTNLDALLAYWRVGAVWRSEIDMETCVNERIVWLGYRGPIVRPHGRHEIR